MKKWWLFGIMALTLGLLPALPAMAKSVNDEAFNELVKHDFPLTPKQIHTFKTMSAKVQEANAQAPGPAPAKGTSNIVPVSLKPGGVMPVVRIGSGQITSLVFMDASGKVWPIVSYVIGDSKSFNVNWNKKGGVLMIQGQALAGKTNIGVMLKGLDVPVMLNLILNQSRWDYLDYVRVAQNQPGNVGGAASVSQAPNFLNDLLTGLAPKGSVELKTNNANVKVWRYKKHYLVLTRSTLLSPQWLSKMATAGGDHPYQAYVIPVTPLLLFSSADGKQMKVEVTEEAPK